MTERTMTVDEALAPLHPVVGVSSLIGAPESVDLTGPKRTPTAAEAREQLAHVQQQQNECKSDYAFWGYEGQLAYLRAAVAITEAAERLGGVLPYVEPPDDSPAVVMDMCARIEQYGDRVSAAARAASS